MFEHLDDPAGFTPDPAFRTRVVARGRSRRRRRLLAASSATVVVLVVAAVGGALALTNRKLDHVQRVDVASITQNEQAPVPPGHPEVLLFVGVDTRPTNDTQGVDGSRSDTMILARIDPAANRLSVLPLARDLWVDIPGHGKGRLNTAIRLGGRDLLVRTVQSVFGVTVGRYVETDFAGAQTIGDALGGLRLSFPAPVRDDHTGLALGAGCQTLRGPDLLALARSRHLQGQTGNRWISDPTSDLGRMERQQAIATALLGRLASVNTHSPTEVARLVDAASRSLVVDSETSNRELVSLVRGIAGSTVVRLRIGMVDAIHGGADVLEATDLDAVSAAFRSGTPTVGPVPSTTTTTPPGGGSGGSGGSTGPDGSSGRPADRTSTPAWAIPTPC